ncbi:MAG: hypothetical protein RLZZ175_3041 [Bacteroidota bacterium]|jgi:hypothetical protein
MNRFIPSNGEAFKLLVEVEASYPVELMLYGYEANLANTVHFLRQYGDANIAEVGLFKGVQRFEFPFPKSVEKLKIEVFDKRTNSKSGLKIKNIKYQPLTLPLRVKFAPHVQEYIDFAFDFSHSCGYHETGTYESETGLYSIVFSDYVRSWEDNTNAIIYTPARVNHTNGIVEVSQYYFNQLTITNRFMILLHEFTHFYFNTKDELECDMMACNICLMLGFSKTECMYAIARLFDYCGTDKQCEAFIERKEMLIDFINNWTNNYETAI